MSILPQLERDLAEAARDRLPVTPTGAGTGSGEASRTGEGARERTRSRLGGLIPAIAAAVTVAIAGLAIVNLGEHRHPSGQPSPAHVTGPANVTGGENPTGQQLYGKARGGVLTVYAASDFESLDPGQSYGFANDYAVDYATQRPLFSYLPDSSTELSPDLATAVPSEANGGITDGGRTVTVHLRQGVYFSPPVNREVTSADVAYAIERGANPNVANPYFSAYFGADAPAPLVGAESPAYKGGPIPGIQTPDKFTIVFHTTKPSGSLLVQALSLPLSAPVPESFAGPLDSHDPTTYGTKYLVATGPYMVKSDSSGMIAGVGDQPASSATPAIGHLLLVRNPNWNPKTDFRPAYLDQINISFGGDPASIGDDVLKGSHSVQLDQPAPSTVKEAYASYRSQLTITPGAGDQYVALNNHDGPFTNVDLRKAVWAALDRQAIVNARGGSLLAQPMTHFIYPGVSGFEQAGGDAGPQVDYNANVNGNMGVAAKYMKLAGYPSGRYTGGSMVQVVASDTGDQPSIARIVDSTLTSLGFRIHLLLVNPSVMYTQYCEVPAQKVDVCPSVGWTRDFGDPQTVLYQQFYGPAITAGGGNLNFGQVDEPQINSAMSQAALIADPAGRATAWASVDQLLVDDAVAVPETFNSEPNIESANVAGVNQIWNGGTWDLSFTSLK